MSDGKIAGCLYDARANLHLRWRGSVSAISSKAKTAESVLRQRAWDLYSKREREIYWSTWAQDFPREYEKLKKENLVPDAICPYFAAVVMSPNRWFVDDVSDYQWVVRRRIFDRSGRGRWKLKLERYALGRAEYLALRKKKRGFKNR